MFRFIGVLIIGAAVGALAERFGLVRNGYVVSIALALGGAVLLWFIQGVIGLRLGYGQFATSVIGGAGMLLLAKLTR